MYRYMLEKKKEKKAKKKNESKSKQTSICMSKYSK